MIPQPYIVTPRLKLVPISHRHAASLWPILSHPMVRQYNDIPEFVDKVEFRDYLQTDIELWLVGKGGRWVLEYNGLVIGSCGLYPLDDESPFLQLSFDLSPDYWQQGLMAEACHELLKAKLHLRAGCHPIYARCKHQNTASIRLLSKLGFKRVLQTSEYDQYKR